MLKVDIKKSVPGFDLEVDFSIDEEILAVLGPSGSGKTMTLKCIAGLVRPDAGHIELNGRVLFDSVRRINLSPQQRKVGFVFQNYALFPHLTVYQNTAYGVQGRSPDEVKSRVSSLLEKMRILGLAQRYPSELSSGQQQRVALARALSNEPELLLLDEPFSALDTPRRERLEFELLALQRSYKGEILLVTHDLAQGYKMGSKVAVYEAGHIVQCDTKDNVVGKPANRTVARLTGFRNLMEGRITRIDGPYLWVTVPRLGQSFKIQDPVDSNMLIDQRVTVGIRPEYVTIAAGPAENAVLSVVSQVVEGITSVSYYFHGKADEDGRYDLEARLEKSRNPVIAPGQSCYVYLPPERLVLLKEIR
ncbi:MAG: ABC transporter ATP-binding protein [Chloroflexi bacterium]|nr:ABC transporter ATP-binding protein [Chloroflexota bacterium]